MKLTIADVFQFPQCILPIKELRRDGVNNLELQNVISWRLVLKRVSIINRETFREFGGGYPWGRRTCANYLEFCYMGDTWFIHSFIHSGLLNIETKRQGGKKGIQIHQIKTLDDSCPVKLLFQVIQTRSELSFCCVLGIEYCQKEKKKKKTGRKKERKKGSEIRARERSQPLTKKPWLPTIKRRSEC